MQLGGYVVILCPIDKGIVGGLILDYAHLGVNVVLHIEIVPIEMVGGDIHEHGYVSAEGEHIVELETAELDDIDILGVFKYLQSQTASYVACKTHVEMCILQDVVDE